MELTLPALIIHGEADPLVPVAAALDTQEALAGSRLLTFEGMGHDLPEPLWDDIVAGISELTQRH
jgi:pimeloyl-ACP methyl ester carboxylesterase